MKRVSIPNRPRQCKRQSLSLTYHKLYFQRLNLPERETNCFEMMKKILGILVLNLNNGFYCLLMSSATFFYLHEWYRPPLNAMWFLLFVLRSFRSLGRQLLLLLSEVLQWWNKMIYNLQHKVKKIMLLNEKRM